MAEQQCTVCARCVACGVDMPGRRKSAIYCDACMHRRKAGMSRMDRQRNPGAGQRVLRGPFKCLHCSVEFFTRRPKGEGETYCGRGCSGKKPRKRGPIADKPSFSRVYFESCRLCATPFAAQSARETYCSEDCRRTVALSKSREYQRARLAVKHTSKICPNCNSTFAPSFGARKNSARYCSAKCMQKTVKRISKAARRAKIKSVAVEMVDPRRVLERDKWKCQLCGVSTPERLRGSCKGNAPEVDHIAPLSLGGAHSYSNLQCACRKCNGLKGATAKGQLGLAIAA